MASMVETRLGCIGENGAIVSHVFVGGATD